MLLTFIQTVRFKNCYLWKIKFGNNFFTLDLFLIIYSLYIIKYYILYYNKIYCIIKYNWLEFSQRATQQRWYDQRKLNASKNYFQPFNNNLNIFFNLSPIQFFRIGDEEDKKKKEKNKRISSAKKQERKKKERKDRVIAGNWNSETHLVTRQQLPPLFHPRFTHGCARSHESCSACRP